MSLTKQDLKAIGKLIEASEGRLMTRIDDLDDTLSRQTSAGFAEVNAKVDDLKITVDRIDRVQQAELQRNDRQDSDIKKMRESLHAA